MIKKFYDWFDKHIERLLFSKEEYLYFHGPIRNRLNLRWRASRTRRYKRGIYRRRYK